MPLHVRILLVPVLLLAALAGVLAAPAPAQAAPTLNQRAVAEVQRHAGKPYQYGAAGPNRFDCSGLTKYVFARLGRSIPRVSRDQYRAVPRVANSAKIPGDLIFTFRSDGTVRHVGIYAGGTYMWAAVQTGDVVRKQNFAHRRYAVGRVR